MLGELLYIEQELGNPEDRYAVSVLKSSTIVGHIPTRRERYQSSAGCSLIEVVKFIALLLEQDSGLLLCKGA